MRNNRSSSLPSSASTENDVLTPNKLFWNYLIFCLLYSSAHGTVDAVLAFSSAELGAMNGSNGGFILYIFYTTSALLLAKPVLGLLGPKNSVLFGLVGMLCYVASFFMALQSHSTNDGTAYIFMFGAVFGGIGAGLLWTAQGAYYSINALRYAEASSLSAAAAASTGGGNGGPEESNRSVSISSSVKALAAGTLFLFFSYIHPYHLYSRSYIPLFPRLINLLTTPPIAYSFVPAATATNATSSVASALAKFAAIFASLYLFLETMLKAFATAIYLALKKQASWRSVVFGMYTVAAAISVVCFAVFVLPMDQASVKRRSHFGASPGKKAAIKRKGPFTALMNSDDTMGDDEADEDVDDDEENDDVNGKVVVVVADNIQQEHRHRLYNVPRRFYGAESIRKDAFAVFRAMFSNVRLQLMLPYQLCFGFSSGFVGFYVMKNVVGANMGDGYIGALSGLGTLTAVLLAWPFEVISKKFNGRGKWHVMVFAAVCFVFVGLPFLIVSKDSDLAHWYIVVPYFLLYGAGRGAWESTNKATIAEYFANDPIRDAAFAAIYFASGLSGALGYFFYKDMTRFEMAILNTIVPIIALFCYHFSERLNFELSIKHRVLAAAVVQQHNRSTNGVVGNNTNASVDSNEELSVDGVNDISLDYHGDDCELDSRTTKPLFMKASVKSSPTGSPNQYITGMNNGISTSGSASVVMNGMKAPMFNHQSYVSDGNNDNAGVNRDGYTVNPHNINSGNNHHNKVEVESKNVHGSDSSPHHQNSSVNGDGNGNEKNGNNTSVFQIVSYEDEEEAS